MKKIFLLLSLLLIPKLSATIYLEPTPQFNPRVQIAIVYIEYDGKILLLHRQDNISQGNKWGNPGGKVEDTETPLQAILRETKEETGFILSSQAIDFLCSVYVEYSERNHFIHHIFRTQLEGDPGSVKIDFNEHKGFTWVTPEDALKMHLLKDEDACIQLIYFPDKVQ